MAHTITLLTRVRVRRVSLDQSKHRVDGDVVIYLLRFFLTMPSRDTPASSRTEASMTGHMWPTNSRVRLTHCHIVIRLAPQLASQSAPRAACRASLERTPAALANSNNS